MKRQDFFDRVYRIEVAAIAPGDTVMIYPKAGMTVDDLRIMRKQASEVWPDNRIVFPSGIARVEVLRPDRISDAAGTMEDVVGS